MADVTFHLLNGVSEALGGVTVVKTYSEIIDAPPEEKRTAEDIIEDFKQRLNGEHYELI